jgi:hypothetical protein
LRQINPNPITANEVRVFQSPSLAAAPIFTKIPTKASQNFLSFLGIALKNAANADGNRLKNPLKLYQNFSNGDIFKYSRFIVFSV